MATWIDQTENTGGGGTTFFFKIDNTNLLLIDNTYKLIISNSSGPIIWTDQTES